MTQTPADAGIAAARADDARRTAPIQTQIVMTVHGVARGVKVALFDNMDRARDAARLLMPDAKLPRCYQNGNGGAMFESEGQTIFLTPVTGSTLTTVY